MLRVLEEAIVRSRVEKPQARSVGYLGDDGESKIHKTIRHSGLPPPKQRSRSPPLQAPVDVLGRCARTIEATHLRNACISASGDLSQALSYQRL